VPILHSAIKKMKQDKVREKRNKIQEGKMKAALKKILKTKSQEDYNKTVSLIDRLAKKRVIHKNKAARLKSRLAKQFKK
jgi:small subunit ribosomal protein S20